MLPRLPLAGLLVLTACPTEPDPADCTLLSPWAVTVKIVTADGGPLEEATAIYRLDGGEWFDCEQQLGDVVSCGYMDEGRYEVVVDALGYGEDTLSIDVSADTCGMQPQERYALLPIPTCTDVEVASTSVLLTSAQGEPLDDATVTYQASDGPWTACEGAGASWQCGWEERGALAILAEAPGHRAAIVDVDVGRDDCHVITEVVDVRLEGLDDEG